jgi:hypothetical protein
MTKKRHHAKQIATRLRQMDAGMSAPCRIVLSKVGSATSPLSLRFSSGSWRSSRSSRSSGTWRLRTASSTVEAPVWAVSPTDQCLDYATRQNRACLVLYRSIPGNAIPCGRR